MAKVIKLKGENFIGIKAKPKEVVFPVTSVDQIIVDAALEKMLPDALKDITNSINTVDGKTETNKGNIEKLAPTPEAKADQAVTFTSASPLPIGVTLKYGTLTELRFNSGSIPDSAYETTIYFTSGSTKTTLELPNGAKIIGEIDVEANMDYIMVIRDGNIVMAPIKTWIA